MTTTSLCDKELLTPTQFPAIFFHEHVTYTAQVSEASGASFAPPEAPEGDNQKCIHSIILSLTHKHQHHNLRRSMPFNLRKSQHRGHADHGWLNTYHTFSFADYYDPRFENFGPLRVLNEDRVGPNSGFPTHPHREFEIWSYVINGALKHKDSMGTQEVIPRGTIQFTSGGTGITHSEYNNSKINEVHFLQIWAKPNQSRLKPSYQLKHFDDEQKIGKLLPVLVPTTETEKTPSAIQIHQDLYMFASLLGNGNEVTYAFKKDKNGQTRRGYLHLCMTGGALTIKGAKDQIRLDQGDGVFITGEDSITVTGNADSLSEFVLIDIPSTDSE